MTNDDDNLNEPGHASALLPRIAQSPFGRVVFALVTVVAFMQLYTFINRSTKPVVDLYSPLDAAIPFLPGTIFVYLSMYLLFGVAAYQIEGARFLRGVTALLVVCLIGCTFFLLMPAHYPRPDPATIENGLLRWAFEQMFAVDPPGNTFPSLHVGTTTTATIMLWSTRARWVFVFWAILICISTMTVKQHFFADVVGGVILACVVYAWVRRYL